MDKKNLGVFFLSLIILVGVLGFMSATTLNVGTGQTYTTIQSAIDAASNDGDTIEVMSGTYNERLSITKNNLIIKEVDGQTAIIQPIEETFTGINRIINILANDITFEGFEIVGNKDLDLDGSYVGISIPGQNVIVRNNQIRDLLTGIQTNTGVITGNNQILNNEISHAYVGISLQNNKNTVDGNTISDISGEGMGIGNGETEQSVVTNNNFDVNLGGVNVRDYTSGMNFLEIAENNNFEKLAMIQNSAGEFQSDALYVSIQDAIDNTEEGDTVYVSAGTYELPKIVIDKDLTISGENKESVIIKASEDTSTSSSDAAAWILVNSNVEFNLNGVTLDGDFPTTTVARGIMSYGTGTISNNKFVNIKSSKYIGMAITIFGNMEVYNNTFEDIERIGVHIRKAYSGEYIGTGRVIGNEFIGNGEGDWVEYGVEIGASSYAEIIGNKFTNYKGVASSDGSTSAGILITDYYGVGTEVDVEENIITDNSEGIAIGYDEEDVSIVRAHNNQIFDNINLAISTTPNVLVNAQNNYWGTNLESEIATLVSENVDYTPWTIQGTDEIETTETEIGSGVYEAEVDTTGTDTNITLTTSSSQTGTITVQQYSEDSHGGFGAAALGKFISIESEIPNNEITNVEIRIYYTDAELLLAGLDETTLKMYYYNTLTSAWEEIPSTVNTAENYVSAITTHFSDYGLGGDEDTEGPSITNVFINPTYPNLASTFVQVFATIIDPSGVKNYPELKWRILQNGTQVGGDHNAPQMDPLGDGSYVTTLNIPVPRDNMTITYKIIAEDKLNHTNQTSAQFKYLFTFDLSNPITSDSASTAWTNANVDVTISCNDAISGCNKTYYSINDVDQGEFTTPTTFTLSATGTYQLKYNSTDNASNSETLKTGTLVRIDKTLPTSSDNYLHNNEWMNANQIISLSNDSDGFSPITIKYCLESSCTPNLDYLTPILISSEGTNYLRYQAVDEAGNVETSVHEKIVKMDKTIPTTSDNAPTGWQNLIFDVTLTATDDLLSGITTYYKIWKTGETETEYSIYSTQILVNVDGEYNIKYYSEDEAENIETPVNELLVQLDTQTPYVAVLNAPFDWTTESANLEVACADGDLSGCNTSTYLIKEFITGTDCTTADYSGAEDNLTMTSHGYVCAKATDNAGNVGYSSLKRILIDVVNPFVEITSPHNNTNLTDTEIFATATDLLSGIDEVTYELRDSTTLEVFKSGSLILNSGSYRAMLSNVLEDVPVGTYTLEVTAKDNVGNELTDSITLNAIEFVQPKIQAVVSNVPYGQNSTVEYNISLDIRNGTAVRMKMSDLTNGVYSYTPEQLNARLVYNGTEYPVRNVYTGDKIILPETVAGASGTVVFKMDILESMSSGSYKATYQFEITE